MKILMLNYMETTAPGGINVNVREVSKHLVKKDHEVTVLQLNPLKLPDEEEIYGFKIIRVSSNYGQHFYDLSLNMILYLKRNLKELNPDIIHIHGYHTLFGAQLLFFLKKIMKINIPLFFSLHYDPLNHSKLAGKVFGGSYDCILGKQILKLPDGIISISDYETNNIKKIYNPHNITVIPHGIDYIDIKKKTKDDYISLLYVGYLFDYKGVQHIIKALNVLINFYNYKKIKLTIIGEGKYKKNLISLSDKLNISDFIEWKHFLPREIVIDEMQKNDIFLLLSKTEGYGIVVAEALAMGTPSIVTNGTALEEFTKEPGCLGVNYPPNPKEVADLILNINKNDNFKVGPFSKKIRTWDEVTYDYWKIYNAILGERK